MFTRPYNLNMISLLLSAALAIPLGVFAKISPHDPQVRSSFITIQDRVDSGDFIANLKIHFNTDRSEVFPEASNIELICYQDLQTLTEQERNCLSTKVFSDGGLLISDLGHSIIQVVLYELDTSDRNCRNQTLRRKVLPINTLVCQEASTELKQNLGIQNLSRYGTYATYNLQSEVERRMEVMESWEDQLTRRPGDGGPL